MINANSWESIAGWSNTLDWRVKINENSNIPVTSPVNFQKPLRRILSFYQFNPSVARGHLKWRTFLICPTKPNSGAHFELLFFFSGWLWRPIDLPHWRQRWACAHRYRVMGHGSLRPAQVPRSLHQRWILCRLDQCSPESLKYSLFSNYQDIEKIKSLDSIFVFFIVTFRKTIIDYLKVLSS